MSLNDFKEHKKNLQKEDEDHYVIGIGASAGGMEAMHELFDNLPKDTNFSYITIQHLSPDYKSLMAELLSKHTEMKVVEAEDNMLVEPNCVYVIPSNKNIVFKNGHLKLTTKMKGQIPNLAIDIFLKSLAEGKREKAIAVILSGTGSDGTKGIEEVKKNGGLVVVQDPSTAKFDGMPNSAIQSGNVDLIVPPKFIPEEIINYVKDDGEEKRYKNISEEDDVLLEEILSQIKSQTSFDFTYYKRPTVIRRIFRRMLLCNQNNLKDYFAFLSNNAEEIDLLSKDFLIGVTRFFRDKEAFSELELSVIPEIFRKKAINEPVKIWVAGCSTGEEAYSIAILIKEYLSKINREFNVKIFATDIDKQSVEFASKGIYPDTIENDVRQEWLQHYFIKEGTQYYINPHIRKMVIFAHHDVIKDPPFSKIDLISCRNLLIYLNNILQKKIMSTFHFSLNGGGFLFLGSSESPGDLKNVLEDVNKKWKIYRLTEQGKTVSAGTFATSNLNVATSYTSYVNRYNRVNVHQNLVEVLNETIMEEYKHVAFFINDNYELIHAIGDFKKYITLPEKKFNLNLLKILPDDLSIALGPALSKMVKNNEQVKITGVRLREENEIKQLTIIAKPHVAPDRPTGKVFMIIFSETKTEKLNEEHLEFFNKEVHAKERLADLEQELKETKESLQSVIEEFETSNEELQSANEELLSANEELQSTNEELQSLNEELHTVNTEHQYKIRELIELNDDLNNYFRGTDIGQIFIDKDLIIRKFTPAATNQINLIESDIGRPLKHLSNNIGYKNLEKDIIKVIETSQSLEKEIEVENNKWYQMRILPYIRQDKRMDGVVITFIDISILKNLNIMLAGVLNSSVSSIVALRSRRDVEGTITDFTWELMNSTAEQLLNIALDNVKGTGVIGTLPLIKKYKLFHMFIDVVETGKNLSEELEIKEGDINGWFAIVAVKMGDGLTITFTDISGKKKADEKIKTAYEELKKAQRKLQDANDQLEIRVRTRTEELAKSNERFRLISEATNDVVRDWDLTNNSVWWNEGLKKLLGESARELETGIDSWYNIIHTEDKDRILSSLHAAIDGGKSIWTDEYRVVKNDKSVAYIFDRGYLMHDENGIPYRMLSSMLDLTDLKEAQEELKRTNKNLIKINSDLDNFIYTASHDLKSPISNIEGLVNTLQDLVKHDNDEIDTIIEMINVSIARFKNTIKDLTEISKIEKELIEDIAKIDIALLLDEIKFSIKDLIVRYNATIKTDLKEHLIRFSKKNLRSILYNLISNGIKYHNKERKPEVIVRTEKADGYIILSVKDNGLGIEKDKQDKIFTMFKRFHDHVDGTGVGLYIVKRMVENSGGKIEVESEPGKGSTFRVYFKETTVASV